MKLIKHSLKVVHGLRPLEISLFKLYLISIVFLAALRIPSLMDVPVWLYALLSVLFLIPLVVLLYQQHGNYIATIFSGGWNIKLFKHRSLMQITMFKMGMLAVGLLIASLFPVVLTAPIRFYFLVAGFGAGYFVSKIVSKA